MPDDLDGWVFDDDFVRGGRYEPPARTRAALTRHGGERTSWRQPGAPVGAEPNVGDGRRRGRSPRRRRVVLGVLALLVAAAGYGVWVYGSRGDGGNGRPPIGERSTIPDVGGTVTGTPDVEGPDVLGINPTTPIGTCFTGPRIPTASTGSPTATPASLQLTDVVCSSAHDYELVAVEYARDSTAYPPDSYWQGSVDNSCRRAFAGYTGRADAVSRPDVAGRSSTFFQPKRDGWARGDRTVYCVAYSATARSGSVRAR